MSVEDPGFELDHFFVAVSDSAAGIGDLKAGGFELSPPHPHTGQGTASRGIIFDNVYLELIWLTDAAEATSAPVKRTRLADRLRTGSGACPFGLGLRRTTRTDLDFSFETWPYSPPYLPEGMSFQMAASSEDLNEPLVFYMPWVSGPIPSPPPHANGARRVTGLELVLTGKVLESPTLDGLSGGDMISFSPGEAFLMLVELDHGESGEMLDLRPEIPVLIRW
jgi:hypothetical protein